MSGTDPEYAALKERIATLEDEVTSLSRKLGREREAVRMLESVVLQQRGELAAWQRLRTISDDDEG